MGEWALAGDHAIDFFLDCQTVERHRDAFAANLFYDAREVVYFRADKDMSSTIEISNPKKNVGVYVRESRLSDIISTVSYRIEHDGLYEFVFKFTDKSHKETGFAFKLRKDKGAQLVAAFQR